MKKGKSSAKPIFNDEFLLTNRFVEITEGKLSYWLKKGLDSSSACQPVTLKGVRFEQCGSTQGDELSTDN